MIEMGSVVCVTALVRAGCAFAECVEPCCEMSTSRGTLAQSSGRTNPGEPTDVSAEIQGAKIEGDYSGRLTRLNWEAVRNINGLRRSEGQAQVRERNYESMTVTDGSCLPCHRSLLLRQWLCQVAKSGSKEADAKNKAGDGNKGENDSRGGLP